MSDGKIVEMKTIKDETVDSELVAFLEMTLERAKKGQITAFSCVTLSTIEGSWCNRAYFRPHIARWSDCLAFTELVQKEVERIRARVAANFE